MTPIEAISENSPFLTVDIGLIGKNIVSHPARPAMGQTLAGKGELVFEGELLEIPLKWHPLGTRH